MCCLHVLIEVRRRGVKKTLDFIIFGCLFSAQEFIRVGYFINNEYSDPEMKENLPSPPQFEKVMIVPWTV